jgi:nicotinate-nucleotide adenylyltransferase
MHNGSPELPTTNYQLGTKTGLFFGSFNPIHIGHLVIANYMATFTGLKDVWLIVSPHNPLKVKSSLANMYDRLEMAKLATENSLQIKVSDIEFKLPQPSYTIDTLTYLHEKYPEKEFVLIMGADNLVSLKKWKNYEILLKNYQFYIYPREGADLTEWENHPSITFTDTPEMEISSTFIRKALKDRKNVQFFVPDSVLEFIDSKGLYK